MNINIYIVRGELITGIGGFVERLSFQEDYNIMMGLADAAQTILYRPDCVARYEPPTGNSVSLIQDDLDKILQQMYGAKHAWACCQKAVVRRAARAKEAWVLRKDLAEHQARRGLHGEALRVTWQGLCVYPTLGALIDCIKRLGPSILSRRSSPEHVKGK